MEEFDSVIKLNSNTVVTATTNSVGNSSNGENITFNSTNNNNNTNNTNSNKITSAELNFSQIENASSGQKKEVKPRAKLSLQEKVKLCQYSLDHPNLKHTQLAQLFKIKRSTVSSILSNTQKWQNLLFEAESSNDPTVQFRLRPPRFPQLELELKEWYLKTKQTIKTIPDSMIVREAKNISKRLDIPDKSLKFSNGWLVRIKKKFNALVEDKQIDILQTAQDLDFPILDDNFLTNGETAHHHHQLTFDLGQLTSAANMHSINAQSDTGLTAQNANVNDLDNEHSSTSPPQIQIPTHSESGLPSGHLSSNGLSDTSLMQHLSHASSNIDTSHVHLTSQLAQSPLEQQLEQQSMLLRHSIENTTSIVSTAITTPFLTPNSLSTNGINMTSMPLNTITMSTPTVNKQHTPTGYYIPPEVGLNSGQVFLDYYKQLEGENSENAQLISNLLQLAKKKTSWEVGKTFLKLLGETNQNCNTEELKLLERLINGSG
jgi:hypothetical protein